eukprot:PhM_4_TR16941/c0_g1_i1/m.18690
MSRPAEQDKWWCVYRKVAVISITTSCFVLAMIAAVVQLHSVEMTIQSDSVGVSAYVEKQSIAVASLVKEAELAVAFLKTQNNFTLETELHQKYSEQLLVSDRDIKLMLQEGHSKPGQREEGYLAIENNLADLYRIRSDVLRFAAPPGPMLQRYWSTVDVFLKALAKAASPVLGSSEQLVCANGLAAATFAISSEATAMFFNDTGLLLAADGSRREFTSDMCDHSELSIRGAPSDVLFTFYVEQFALSVNISQMVRNTSQVIPVDPNVTEYYSANPSGDLAAFVVDRVGDADDEEGSTFYVGYFVGCAMVLVIGVVAIATQAVMAWRHNAVHNKELVLQNEVTKLIESTDRIQTMYQRVVALESLEKPKRSASFVERALYAMIEPIEDVRKYLHPALLKEPDPEVRQELLHETGLKPRRITFVVVNTQHFHNRISAESASQKHMANQVQRFLSYIHDIAVVQHGGMLHKATANTVSFMWGACPEDPLEDFTQAACDAALQMSKASQDGNGRVSVCTGECLVGVVGNDVVKSFVVCGPTVPMSQLLVRIGSQHDSGVTMDQRSFQLLDIQKYKGRPLERLSVQGIQTTAFELLLTMEKDAKTTTWLDAFEAYNDQNSKHALEVIDAAQARNITSASLKRLQFLMRQEPPTYVTSRPSSETVVVDDDIL